MRPIDPNSTQQQLLRLSEKSGIPIATLRARLRAGVPFEELTQPRKRGRRDAIQKYHHKFWAGEIY